MLTILSHLEALQVAKSCLGISETLCIVLAVPHWSSLWSQSFGMHLNCMVARYYRFDQCLMLLKCTLQGLGILFILS